MTLPVKERRRRAKAAKKAPGRGRPKKVILPKSIEALAELGCDNKTMALVLGMNVGTFQRRLNEDPAFREAMERGQASCKVKLRQLQWRHAEGEGGPAVNMAIHLSKHQLGEFDRPVDTHSTVDINVEISGVNERITQKLADLQRRISGPAIGQEGNQALPVIDGEFTPVLEAVPERVDGGMAVDAPTGRAERVPGGSDAG